MLQEQRLLSRMTRSAKRIRKRKNCAAAMKTDSGDSASFWISTEMNRKERATGKETREMSLMTNINVGREPTSVMMRISLRGTTMMMQDLSIAAPALRTLREAAWPKKRS